MSGPSFLDTNILVYADDLDANATRRGIARQIVKDAFSEPRAVVSTQVLKEFFVVATRKLGIEAAIARRKIELLSQLNVVSITPAIILQAIDLHRLHALSFWDALIVRCASTARCVRVLTEDMQNGPVIDGVRIARSVLMSHPSIGPSPPRAVPRGGRERRGTSAG